MTLLFKPPIAGRQLTTTRRGLKVRDRRLLQELLHQQLWCWGRDVVPGPGGPPVNLLIQYGLERHESVTRGLGSNRYSSSITVGFRVHLWAFGVCVEDAQGSVFLHRYHRGPRVPWPGWLPTNASGRPEDVPLFPRPNIPTERATASLLLEKLLRWTAAYERWINRTLGGDYRHRTLRRWEHPAVPAGEMAAAWLSLAEVYRRARNPHDAIIASANPR